MPDGRRRDDDTRRRDVAFDARNFTPLEFTNLNADVHTHARREW